MPLLLSLFPRLIHSHEWLVKLAEVDSSHGQNGKATKPCTAAVLQYYFKNQNCVLWKKMMPDYVYSQAITRAFASFNDNTSDSCL